MSRLNPWENTSAGAARSPAARTARSVPSGATSGPRSSGGSSVRRSDRSGSGRPRWRWIRVRDSATLAAVPATAPATIAAARRLRIRAPPSRRGALEVLARDPFADPAHDLVGDRSGELRKLRRRHLLVALASDQDDLVARLDVVVPAVDHE